MISSLNCVTCSAIGNISLLPSRKGEVAGLDPQSRGSMTNDWFHSRLTHRSLAGSPICTCKKGVTNSPVQVRVCAIFLHSNSRKNRPMGMARVRQRGTTLAHFRLVATMTFWWLRRHQWWTSDPPSLLLCLLRVQWTKYYGYGSLTATCPCLMPPCSLNADGLCPLVSWQWTNRSFSLSSTNKLKLTIFIVHLFTLISHRVGFYVVSYV